MKSKTLEINYAVCFPTGNIVHRKYIEYDDGSREILHHNLNGPAIIYKDGHTKYYLNGQLINVPSLKKFEIYKLFA